jgi:hypothetical protein
MLYADLLHQAENVFYREARFYFATEMEKFLRDIGFVEQTWEQTLSKPLNEIQETEPFRVVHGDCGFVVVAAAGS